MNLKYVPEYDGLRAIAVIGVLVFHFGFNLFPGGFVGVDVFFVISGYLISKIIFTEIENNKFSLLNFYERRFRRIIPALIVTLIITTLVFGLITTPSESEKLQSSLISAATSFSNIYFHITTDYFNNNDSNPYLHTWSLAVEEQFYLFFPLLLLFLFKKSIRSRKIALFVIFISSLIASSIYVYWNASAAFYLPHFRAWELMTGTAVLILQKKSLQSKLKRLLSILGPLLIFSSFSFLHNDTIFPGISALPAVFGAAFTIMGAGSSTPFNKILASKVPVFIGKISYSLYLIHWPIVCVMTTFGWRTNGPFGGIAFIVCVILAWLSYQFVEKPFRNNKFGKTNVIYIGTLGALLITILIGFSTSAIKSFVWSQSPAALSYAEKQNTTFTHFGNPNCFLTSNRNDFSLYIKNSCLRIDPTRENILVMGDSHSAHFMSSIKKIFPEANILQASASGCLPLLESIGEKRCTDLIKFILTDWLKEHGRGIKTVIVSGRWEARDIGGIAKLSDHLHTLGTQAIILGPSQEYKVELPKILALEALYGIELKNVLLRKERILVDKQLKLALPPKVRYFSTATNLCSQEVCETIINNTPALFDKDHFTEIAADYALKGLKECSKNESTICSR